jgi:hypothetical protein
MAASTGVPRISCGSGCALYSAWAPWPDLSTPISTGKERGSVLGKRAERGRWPLWESLTMSRRPSFRVEQRILAKSPLQPPCSIAATWPLDGLIWPEDGCASIALPQRRSPTSFPCRLRRHSSRIKQVGASPSSAALRLEAECGVDRSRPVDRHRGRDGRGLDTEIRGALPWRTSALSKRSMPSFRARS